MLEGLQLLQRNWGFRLEIRDIDADEELRRRYHDKVPVVEGGGRELCRYRLDEEALRGYLNGP
jgi:thioredoxin reductase (NADPH)